MKHWFPFSLSGLSLLEPLKHCFESTGLAMESRSTCGAPLLDAVVVEQMPPQQVVVTLLLAPDVMTISGSEVVWNFIFLVDKSLSLGRSSLLYVSITIAGMTNWWWTPQTSFGATFVSGCF